MTFDRVTLDPSGSRRSPRFQPSSVEPHAPHFSLRSSPETAGFVQSLEGVCSCYQSSVWSVCTVFGGEPDRRRRCQRQASDSEGHDPGR
nr:hypothetical protein CFP56_38768 [Quercus suber]